MKTKEVRNNPLFLRNEFETVDKWEMPLIRRETIDLEVVDLISFSDIRYNDNEVNRKKGVHFFIDDYRFEGVYRNPERSISRLSQYAFVLTPDYSTYSNMNYWRQLESIAHSRWCGAYWQDQGLTVIPTISWSTSPSYDFCFSGIEKHSIVAVGMIGCKHSKESFMSGYNRMLEEIAPDAIICFGTPFEEMEGNIVSVDYISSRRVVR